MQRAKALEAELGLQQESEAGRQLFSLPSSTSFRVQGIPSDWDQKRTKLGVNKALGLDSKTYGLKVHSLADSPYRHESKRVATITFQKVPARLQNVLNGYVSVSIKANEDISSDDDEQEITELIFDINFLGLTPLSSYQNTQTHKIE